MAAGCLVVKAFESLAGMATGGAWVGIGLTQRNGVSLECGSERVHRKEKIWVCHKVQCNLQGAHSQRKRAGLCEWSAIGLGMRLGNL